MGSLGILLLGLGSSYNVGEFLFAFFVQLANVTVFTIMVWAIMKGHFYLSLKELKWEIPQLAVIMQVTYFIVLQSMVFGIHQSL